MATPSQESEDSTRIALIQWQGQRAWRKLPAPARGWWRYRFLGLMSRAMGLFLLKPVPQPGGQEALATEARRIKALTQAGVRVPQILHEQADELILSDIGLSLSRVCKLEKTGQQERLGVFRLVFPAVVNLHRSGAYVSQCFSRNVMLDDEQVGFIDFEDDPLQVMDLHHAQARDWLMLVMSSARFFEASPTVFRELLWHHLEQDDAEVVVLVKETASRLNWIRRLPFKRALGGDYRRLRIALEVLN